MQFTIKETAKTEILKNSVVSIPKSLYSGKILGNELELDSCYCVNANENALLDLWNKQHPLIHTWLVLSSISICFIFALFFIFRL